MNWISAKVSFVKYWTWVHWLAMAAVLAISVKELYENQVARLRALDQQSVEVIEEDSGDLGVLCLCCADHLDKVVGFG